MISMSIDEKKWEKEVESFIKKKDREFASHIKKSTITMHRDAYNGAPHVSNFLRNHIRSIFHNKYYTEVHSAANYSEAVEEGTKSHVINVRNKKVLAGHKRYAPAGWPFISGDYALYGKRVKHPGTEAHPFMRPAWEKAKDRFYTLIHKSL